MRRGFAFVLIGLAGSVPLSLPVARAQAPTRVLTEGKLFDRSGRSLQPDYSHRIGSTGSAVPAPRVFTDPGYGQRSGRTAVPWSSGATSASRPYTASATDAYFNRSGRTTQPRFQNTARTDSITAGLHHNSLPSPAQASRRGGGGSGGVGGSSGHAKAHAPAATPAGHGHH